MLEGVILYCSQLPSTVPEACCLFAMVISHEDMALHLQDAQLMIGKVCSYNTYNTASYISVAYLHSTKFNVACWGMQWAKLFVLPVSSVVLWILVFNGINCLYFRYFDIHVASVVNVNLVCKCPLRNWMV